MPDSTSLRTFVALTLALALTTGCDEETRTDGGTLPDAGSVDSGGGGVDSGGGGVDSGGGGVDSGGGGVDSGGGGVDAGDGSDSGPAVDAGVDAGCTPAVCAAADCGTIDDGCGGTVDCGACDDGAPCDDDADCDSGLCFTQEATGFLGGLCTRVCRDDTDCDVADHCARIDPITLVGFCRTDCIDADDCRAGYACEDADLAPEFVPDGELECTANATGTGAVGDPCTAAADCAGGAEGFCALESFGFRGGYCTLECDTTDDMCPTGSHCSAFEGSGPGLCVLDCGADAECRGGTDGYLCFDGDGQGTDECYPAGTGATPIGGACDGIWDCAGGQDARCLEAGFMAGYCVEVGCSTDTDCGSGAHCGTFTFGGADVDLCTPDCTPGTTVCAAGQVCWDPNEDAQPECWAAGTGAGAVGDACEAIYECAGDERAVCVQEDEGSFVDGYCTLSGCTIGGTGTQSCPTGSHCSVSSGETVGFCVRTCADASACRSDGYDCYDNEDMGTETECLPAATGTGAIGDPCLGRNDCAGGQQGLCVTPSATFRGGYCTFDCGSVACPTGASCETFGAAMRCLDDCAADADCREPHYSCQDTADVGDPDVCFPASSG